MFSDSYRHKLKKVPELQFSATLNSKNNRNNIGRLCWWVYSWFDHFKRSL